MKIPTGSNCFDEFLDGGYSSNITTIYGGAATGKTTLVKLAAIEQLKNNKVIFLDTENGFSVERFEQLAGEAYKKLLENLLLFKIKSFKEQQLKIKSLKELVEKARVSLVIIDTLGFYYRRLVKRKHELANSMLISQLRILKNLGIPVLITNQVYSKISENRIEVIGGNIIRRASTFLIELQKDDKRKAILKEPSPQKQIFFNIVEKGIVQV
jgi:DNA repair protein RadB